MAFKMNKPSVTQGTAGHKSALKSAPGDHTYHEGKPKKHTHGKYAVDEDSTDEDRLAISRRMQKDDPGYAESANIWPGTNLSKDAFNEDGTKKKENK